MASLHTVFEFSKTVLFLMLWFVLEVSCAQCPEKKPAENFNISDIGTGEWYEVARYPYPSPSPVKHMTYASRMEKDVYIAETIYVNKTSPYYTQVICKMLPEANGRAMMKFSLYSGHQLQIKSPVLYLLAVDYNKYMIPYTCIYDADKDEFQEYAWILSRKLPKLGQSKQEYMDILKDLDQDKLIWID